MRKNWLVIALTLSLLSLFLLGRRFLEPNSLLRYEILQLGTLPGGTYSGAFDINKKGLVVGYSETKGDWERLHAFVWDATSGMKDIGSVLWEARINDRGQIAGRGSVPDGTNSWSHVFVWDATSGFTDLGPVIDDANRNIGINGSGRVYWIAPDPTPDSPFRDRYQIWSVEEGRRDLSIEGNEVISISDMNGKDVVVGMLSSASGTYHGFRYSEEGGVQILSSTMFAGLSMEPMLINDSGAIVGVAYGGWKDQIFIYEGGETRYADLPKGSFAEPRGWNNRGQLVGVSTNTFQDLVSAFRSSLYSLGRVGSLIEDTLFPPTNEPEEFWPFLWENGVTTDLRALVQADSEWSDLSPQAINEAGQIVGWGVNDGKTRAFLMNPIEGDRE